MPDLSNSKDKDNSFNDSRAQIRGTVKNTQSGQIVTSRSADTNVDALGDSLKQTIQPIPLVAKPGKFPNGRSTPGSKKVIKFEKKRQEYELEMALSELEALREIAQALNVPAEPEYKAPEGSNDYDAIPNNYNGKYAYGEGVGEVKDAGGFAYNGGNLDQDFS